MSRMFVRNPGPSVALKHMDGTGPETGSDSVRTATGGSAARAKGASTHGEQPAPARLDRRPDDPCPYTRRGRTDAGGVRTHHHGDRRRAGPAGDDGLSRRASRRIQRRNRLSRQRLLTSTGAISYALPPSSRRDATTANSPPVIFTTVSSGIGKIALGVPPDTQMVSKRWKFASTRTST